MDKNNLELYWKNFVNKHELEFMDNKFSKDIIFDFVNYAIRKDMECPCEHCAGVRLGIKDLKIESLYK